MTKKPVVQVTKPASSLCNGQVSRAARVAIETNLARIKKAVDAIVEQAKKEGEGDE